MKVEADVSTVYVISPSVSCIVRNEECNGSCAFLDGVADEGPEQPGISVSRRGR